MSIDRVTAYAIQADGSRSFGLTVNGIKILLTAAEGQHDAGHELANKIARTFIPAARTTDRAETPKPVAETPAYKPKRRDFVVGQRVWCNVHGAQGECTITAIGDGRNAGRVKITNERGWCHIGNFDALEGRS